MVNEIDSLMLKYSSILGIPNHKTYQTNNVHQAEIIVNADEKNSSSRIISEDDLKQISIEINKLVASKDLSNRRVELHYNKELNRVIITVYDKESNEVLREIPCKELQNLALYLKEAIGLIFDNKA